MDLKDVISFEVKEGLSIWPQIKADWKKLELPGSPYSPMEFIVCLLLSRIPADSLIKTIEEGKENYRRLVNERIVPGYISKEELAVIFTASLANDTKMTLASIPDISRDPQLVQEPVAPKIPESCPYCGHDFEECLKGVYLEKEALDEPKKSVPEEEKKECEKESQKISFCQHVDDKGKCMVCSKEDTIQCSDCREGVIESRAFKCRSFDHCEIAFCEECKDGLSERGYCEDCATFYCDGGNCQELIDRDTEIRCANPGCPRDDDYCKDCANRLLNETGFCSDCSGEEETDCSSCGSPATSSRLIRCANPDCEDENAYCHECADELDKDGFCPDCG
ncbi:MAG: hypothetical protein HY764_00265 [Candidatus Portnoybacteria bacterium]|nr:hypothetical protein [Candidatus Portnoybacteria bacterium]